MQNNTLLALLRLSATKHVGDITAKKLIHKFGCPKKIFESPKSYIKEIKGINTLVVNEIYKDKYLQIAKKQIEEIEKNNISYSYFLDESYPKNLKNCVDAPILLFKEGNIQLKNKKIISIVGTRNCTSYGKGFIKELVQELKKYNPIIISGFAYGCDIEAHKAAIDNNLQTIGVLAHGFDIIYPKVHKKYVNIVRENGGFITEFKNGTEPIRENFLKRNRIVAGISEALIVIESASKGGSLNTATVANSYNKEVFALPGKINDIYSKGCNNLIKSHKANILTDAHDIVTLLNWDIAKKNKKTPQLELFLNLNDQEQLIYDNIKNKGKQHIDLIAKECELPIFKVSALLTTMELKGIIKKLPGKQFEI